MIFLVVWLISAPISYGIFFGIFQNGWPQVADRERGLDVKLSLILAVIGGPVALLVGTMVAVGRRLKPRWF